MKPLLLVGLASSFPSLLFLAYGLITGEGSKSLGPNVFEMSAIMLLPFFGPFVVSRLPFIKTTWVGIFLGTLVFLFAFSYAFVELNIFGGGEL